MRLIFAGTPPFAARALAALHGAGHEIALVLTQPDRPAGRGMQLSASAVSAEAERLSLRIEKPQSLKVESIQAILRDARAEVMVAAAYGLILPQAVLDIPAHGCINIHGSLLPRWRGAAPVQRAIEAGDAETGIAIMQMDAGLDTGAVLLEKTLPILADDTSATLFAKLTDLGATAIVEALASLSQWAPASQPEAGVTYARKIEKSEGRIDWAQSAAVLERRMRAFDPFPGCESKLDGNSLKIWRGAVVEVSGTAQPGTVIESNGDRVLVQCGRDAVELKVVQKPGGKRMSIADLQRAGAIRQGARFA